MEVLNIYRNQNAKIAFLRFHHRPLTFLKHNDESSPLDLLTFVQTPDTAKDQTHIFESAIYCGFCDFPFLLQYATASLSEYCNYIKNDKVLS